MANAEDLRNAEKRRLPRTRVGQAVEVFDQHTEEPIGRVVDLTVEGLMLLTPEDVPAHGIYQLVIPLPVSVEGCAQIRVGVESLWCRESNDGQNHWTGFHIIDISDEDRACIERLIGAV